MIADTNLFQKLEERKTFRRNQRTNRNITTLQRGQAASEREKPAKKILFTTDGYKTALSGYCMYFLRTSSKRTLGEETFQVSSHKFIT